jgi:cell division septum initiation protein DivIVA
VSGTASRIEQLIEDHSELRQGLKRLRKEVKATNYIKAIEVRNTISN